MAKTKGLASLKRKLAAIQGAPRKATRAALETGAQEITALQKRLVPAESGALRDSIGYVFGEFRPDNANVRGVGVGRNAGDPDLSVTIKAGSAEAYYAAFLEFGTAGPYEVGGFLAPAVHPGIKPQPYFYPAYRALKRRVKGRITRAMTKAIREAARG